MTNKYDFGEKDREYSNKRKDYIPVWISPKYTEARKAAIALLESKEYGDVLTISDFWILMNETKSGKMGYTGLILSHNGCLKINDKLPAEKKFRPDCISIDTHGFGGSLVFQYCCPDQGIYEVGELNERNCKSEYPYAMALKRCYDRVVLKSSKLAYSGIYSDSEADEFAAPDPEEMEKRGEKEIPSKTTPKEPSFTSAAPRGEEPTVPPTPVDEEAPQMFREEMIDVVKRLYSIEQQKKLFQANGVSSIDQMTDEQLQALMVKLRKAGRI